MYNKMLLSFWNNIPYDFQRFLLLLRTLMRVVVVYIVVAMWINYKMTYLFPVKTTIMTVNQLKWVNIIYWRLWSSKPAYN